MENKKKNSDKGKNSENECSFCTNTHFFEIYHEQCDQYTEFWVQ